MPKTLPVLASDPLISQVLEQVNRIRVGLGAGPIVEMPAGRIRSTSSCPLARALDCGFVRPRIVSERVMRVWGDKRKSQIARILGTRTGSIDNGINKWNGSTRYISGIRLTGVMEQFVTNFDNGEYPELIA